MTKINGGVATAISVKEAYTNFEKTTKNATFFRSRRIKKAKDKLVKTLAKSIEPLLANKNSSNTLQSNIFLNKKVTQLDTDINLNDVANKIIATFKQQEKNNGNLQLIKKNVKLVTQETSNFINFEHQNSKNTDSINTDELRAISQEIIGKTEVDDIKEQAAKIKLQLIDNATQPREFARNLTAFLKLNFMDTAVLSNNKKAFASVQLDLLDTIMHQNTRDTRGLTAPYLNSITKIRNHLKEKLSPAKNITIPVGIQTRSASASKNNTPILNNISDAKPEELHYAVTDIVHSPTKAPPTPAPTNKVTENFPYPTSPQGDDATNFDDHNTSSSAPSEILKPTPAPRKNIPLSTNNSDIRAKPIPTPRKNIPLNTTKNSTINTKPKPKPKPKPIITMQNEILDTTAKKENIKSAIEKFRHTVNDIIATNGTVEEDRSKLILQDLRLLQSMLSTLPHDTESETILSDISDIQNTLRT